MKKSLMLITVLLGLSSFGWAGACGVSTLSIYDTPGFSCTIGDKTFSGFTYSAGGSNPRQAAGIRVDVVATGPEQGLLFTSVWEASNGRTSTAVIGYTVTEVGKLLLDDAELGMSAFGHRDPTVNESAGGASLFAFYDGSTNPPAFRLDDFAKFPAVASLNVQDTLFVGGTGKGRTGITRVFNGFSEVPEPGTLTLFGSGLMALAGFARRRVRQ
jgi:hypothetical protein